MASSATASAAAAVTLALALTLSLVLLHGPTSFVPGAAPGSNGVAPLLSFSVSPSVPRVVRTSPMVPRIPVAPPVGVRKASGGRGHTDSCQNTYEAASYRANIVAMAAETASSSSPATEQGSNGDDEDLPTDLRQATEQAAEACKAAIDKGETFLRVGLLIEEMVRGAKQNTDLQEPRVLCRVGAAISAKTNLPKIKFMFSNVGMSMQHKKWLEEKGSNNVVTSLDRPQMLDGSEDMVVLVKPDQFALKNVLTLVQKIEEMPYEERPTVVMLNENFGDQEDKGEGFLNVPQLETVQARRLKSKFMVSYFLEQVLSRQAGIIVLFKKYPKPWQLFVADDGAYKLVQTSLREPSDDEIFDGISEFNRNRQASKLWRSFRWRRQVEGLLDNFGIPKPFQEWDANKNKKSSS